MKRTTELLETCFKELLNKVTSNRLKTITLPISDTLVIPESPTGITKTPKPRYISNIYLSEDKIYITCISNPQGDKRCKAKIYTYTISQFDEYTQFRLLQLGIKYLNIY